MTSTSTAAAASSGGSDKSSSSSQQQPSIPSNLAHLAPLTKNELLLLSTYERIKQYEKISAKLKAEEAKRRLEEADERYRAKVRERERAENGGDDDIDGDSGGGDVASKKYAHASENSNVADTDDNNNPSTITQPSSTAAAEARQIEKQKQRQLEISQLRADIEASQQKDKEITAQREKEEIMRRELLGDELKKKKRKKKRPRDDDEVGVEDDDAVENDNDEGEDNNEEMKDESSLQQSKTIISGPSIKKKRIEDNTTNSSWDSNNPNNNANTAGTSLIANMSAGITPPHDFSKDLKMSKTSLDGSILFPTNSGTADEKMWVPPSNPLNFMDGCLELELPKFDPTSSSSGGSNNNNNNNNTLAIKFHAPQESSRFSINISTLSNNSQNNRYESILFHFNPRQFQRGGQLVINNKIDGMWGNDLAVPLSTLPLVFGKQACTLIVQINGEEFDVFVEGVHCARLEHRTPLSQVLTTKKNDGLVLQFPSSDDYGNPENWMVYRVWWGYKPSMSAGKDISGVAGVNLYSSIHPKKLFVSGLSKIHSDPEVDLRRAELERAFRKYGGPNGAVFVSVQKDSTFAFVEVASEQQADLALVEMNGRYRVNKARRTKHEAIMEERAAKEAAEKGVVKESVDWD